MKRINTIIKPINFLLLAIIIPVLLFLFYPKVQFQKYMDKIESGDTLKYIIITKDKPHIKLLEKLSLKLNDEKDDNNYKKIEYYYLDESTESYLRDYAYNSIKIEDDENYEVLREKAENRYKELALESNFGYFSIDSNGIIQNNLKDIDYENYPSFLARWNFPAISSSLEDFYNNLDEKYHKEFISWINYLGGNIK